MTAYLLPYLPKQEITTLHPIPAWHHLRSGFPELPSYSRLRLLLWNKSIPRNRPWRQCRAEITRRVGCQPTSSTVYSVSVGLWEPGWYLSHAEETPWNKTGAKGAGSVSTVGFSGALHSPNILLFKVISLSILFVHRGLYKGRQSLMQLEKTSQPLCHV